LIAILKHSSLNEVSRIMIRTTNWIGDAVMTTPALRAVRESFPDADITIVANPLVAQLFESHPDCDGVIVYDRKGKDRGLLGFLRFCARLRREHFDLSILFQNAIEAALIAFIAGVPKRLGYTHECRRLLLTHPVTVTPQLESMHHTDYYLNILAHYGVVTTKKEQRLLICPDEQEWAQQVLPTGAVATINPGAAYGSAKRWLPQRFAAVADQLVDEYGMSIILTGGPAEAEIGHDIAAAMKSPCTNFIGKTNVRELMALLANSNLMITNDSGPMHIGAALQTPLVAVFGPTNHTTTSPWSDNSQIVRHDVGCSPCMLRQCPTDHRCMESVTVEDVMAAVKTLLSDAP